MTIRRTDVAARAAPPASPSVPLTARQAASLSKKLGSGVEGEQLEAIALLVKYGAYATAGQQLLQTIRTATPAQAAVIHDLIHRRLGGADVEVPRGQAALARRVQAQIDQLGGGDDLKKMRTFALNQQYRHLLSPAGAKLFDRMRLGAQAELDVIFRELTVARGSAAPRQAGWSPR